jgi:hypothetical protein
MSEQKKNTVMKISLPIEVLQALALLKLRMQRIRLQTQQVHQWHEASDTVYCGKEYERSSWVTEEEVIQVDVLFMYNQLAGRVRSEQSD